MCAIAGAVLQGVGMKEGWYDKNPTLASFLDPLGSTIYFSQQEPDKPPPVEEPEPPPDVTAEQTQLRRRRDAATDNRRRRVAAKSTVLTSPLGIQTDDTPQRKTLLGG
jgi:hypothetical protein